MLTADITAVRAESFCGDEEGGEGGALKTRAQSCCRR